MKGPKLFLLFLIAVPLLFLVSCQTRIESSSFSPINSIGHYHHLSFEEAVLNRATNIVVVNYLGSRMIDNTWLEFEFAVVENILGETTERIMVHVDVTTETHLLGHGSHSHHNQREALGFQRNVNYLLPLTNINDPYFDFNLWTANDIFVFIRGIAVNLNNPIESVMYGENLNEHIDGVNLLARDAYDQIIELVEELAIEIEVNQTWEHQIYWL